MCEVFYKDGVRFAGYYETPGDLVQDMILCGKSMELLLQNHRQFERQGTNIQSNDPRLNIPGTPENLT